MRTTAAAMVVLLALAACGGGASASDASVDVFAASSLAGAFAEIAAAFEAERGVDVELNLAGSSSLREQILAGAPADVFAPASESHRQAVVDAGLAAGPETFATTRLQIAVPAGNPGGVGGLADLADGDLLVGLCAPEVPCGELGRAALDAAGVVAAVDTEEPDARSLVTKVAAGELDAGLVYVTDVQAAGAAVEGIDVPAAVNPSATYPIAALDTAGADFVAFVLSEEGQAILAAHGFGGPEA